MAGPRPRFFFPRLKVDREAQTRPTFKSRNIAEPLFDRMHAQAIEAILRQDPRPSNGIELSYMLDYSSHLAFCISSRFHERFDLLTPPPGLFHDFPVSFEVQLHNDCFQISAVDKERSFNSLYSQAFVPIIESLEAGIIQHELFGLLKDQIEIDSWEDGHLLCRIIDHRFSEPREFRRMLKVSQEVLAVFVRNRSKIMGPSASLDSERRILLQVHPVIPIDPSPDVARFQSTLDWREKLWRRRRKIEESDFTVAVAPVPTKKLNGNVTLCPLTQPLILPDEIVQEFSNALRAIE